MTVHPASGAILSRSDTGGIARLTLNNPASRNSLSEAMMAALRAALADISGDRSVRVVILSAAGPVFPFVDSAIPPSPFRFLASLLRRFPAPPLRLTVPITPERRARHRPHARQGPSGLNDRLDDFVRDELGRATDPADRLGQLLQ